MQLAVWLMVGLMAPILSQAEVPPHDLAQVRLQALQTHLAYDEGWLALGHYRAGLVGWVSDADDASFFLGHDGKHDPEAELLATLVAVYRPGDGDDHPACRFPARAHWLAARLARPLPNHACPAFQAWRDKMGAHAVSLIFPAAYLNSPSSMFGHTFLRLEPREMKPDQALLAATVNYAADADDDNELFYAFRGLAGGYPGRITVQPYYEKVKEYNDWENRDIWEYRLTLAPAEVDQLVRHVWELLPVRFDYFFIGENCSYRLLAMLDVARPGLGLRHKFAHRAIPADTVRAIVDAGLVHASQYRPSAATLLGHHLDQLTHRQKALVRQLADHSKPNPGLAQLPASQRAAVLETAYEFSRYRAAEEKRTREASAPISYRLLRERSRIDAPSPLGAPDTPEVRDDQGHLPQAIGASFGVLDDRAFGELRLRSAYHALTDPWPGYKAGAQIRFLDGALRYYEDDQIKLDRLDVLDIRSLSPRDGFFKPWSWGIALGAHRIPLQKGRPLLGSFRGEIGHAYEVAGGLAFATLSANFETGTALSSGVQLGLGPRLGWLYRGVGGQGLFSLDIVCHLIQNPWCGGRLSMEHTVNLGRNLSLNIRLSRERGQNRDVDEIGIGIHRYF